MTEEATDLIGAAQELRDSPAWTKVQNAFVTMMGVVPPLQYVFSELIPDWRVEQTQKFLETVASEIVELGERFDEQKAQTVEFGLLLEKVATETIRTTSEEKLAAYRAVILNSCSPSSPNTLERDYLLGLLEKLQEVHIVILALLRDQHGFCKKHKLAPTHGTNRTFYCEGTLERTLAKYLAPLSNSVGLAADSNGELGPVWKSAFRDLQDRELVSRETGMGEQHAENLTVFLTAFGVTFANFIAPAHS